MKRLLAAVLPLLAPAYLGSQTIVGSDPNALYRRSMIFMAGGGQGFVQSFIASGVQLQRAAIWHHFEAGFGSRVSIVRGLGLPTCGSSCPGRLLHSAPLKVQEDGKVDLGFDRPLALEVGATYSIVVQADWCTPPSPFCVPPTAAGDRDNPYIEVSVGDAFADGRLYRALFDDDFWGSPPAVLEIPNRDLRFELQYATVSETATLPLLGAGLLLFLLRRRRMPRG